LSAELEEASGAPVIPISGAANIGVDWVLDNLIEAIGPAHDAVAADDDGEDAIEWSPV
jgi:GTP-binding protein